MKLLAMMNTKEKKESVIDIAGEMGNGEWGMADCLGRRERESKNDHMMEGVMGIWTSNCVS